MMNWRPADGLVGRSPTTALLVIVIATGIVAALALEASSATTTVVIISMVATLVWGFSVYPLERRVREQWNGMLLLFTDNPAAIAIYDRKGALIRGNRAAARMLRRTQADLIGAPYTSHMLSAHLAAAQTAFDAALNGATIEFEAVVEGPQGEAIDIRTTFSPHRVKERVVGVYSVSRDIGELRRAQAGIVEQAERIRELYAVAAAGSLTSQEQIEQALAIACRHLKFEYARLSDIVEGESRTIATHPANDPALAHIAFDSVLLAKAARGTEFVSLGIAGMGFAAPVPLSIGHGALQIWSCHEHESLTAIDHDFVRLVTALVGAAAQRGYQQARLDQLAFFDVLTGLPNRVMVSDRLAELLTLPRWRGVPFAVHYIDLDRFKAVNDTFGHGVGDQILRLAARRMRDAIGEGDMLARLGGDEFVVIQPLEGGPSSSKALALRILATIAAPFEVDGLAHQMGVSIGVSIAPNDGSDSQTLLERADEALYRAKREGRNRLEFAPEAARLTSFVPAPGSPTNGSLPEHRVSSN